MAKVTVYVDDTVWSKFRASVFQRRGSLKGLSEEVEGSLRSALVDEDTVVFLQTIKSGLKVGKRARPVLRGPSAGPQVRAMRRKRFESLSR
jgi:hypothetical protein